MAHGVISNSCSPIGLRNRSNSLAPFFPAVSGLLSHTVKLTRARSKQRQNLPVSCRQAGTVTPIMDFTTLNGLSKLPLLCPMCGSSKRIQYGRRQCPIIDRKSLFCIGQTWPRACPSTTEFRGPIPFSIQQRGGTSIKTDFSILFTTGDFLNRSSFVVTGTQKHTLLSKMRSQHSSQHRGSSQDHSTAALGTMAISSTTKPTAIGNIKRRC